jgi:methylmalonyl-CoA/ethylmalonyl-CoA epimerase
MRVVQIGQHAHDLERASAFYAQLLGQPPAATFDPPGLVFFLLGETRLLLDRALPSSVVYFKVDDVRTRVEELRVLGVEIEGEPHLIFSHADDTLGPAGTDEWMAFIKDTEGNVVGLVSQLTTAP